MKKYCKRFVACQLQFENENIGMSNVLSSERPLG